MNVKPAPVLLSFLGWLFIASVLGKRIDRRDVADVVSNWIFKDKCMGELGCFNNGAPFFNFLERPLSFLPSDRESINTHFLLYTRMNRLKPQNFTNLHPYPQELLQSKFLPESPIKFIVPGFISSWAPNWEDPLKDLLLHAEDCNVFIVDWTGGNGPLYEQAVANTRVVGAEIAVFIEFLQNSTKVQPSDIHPGPYFENVDPQVRLNSTDATLVDVIHTNGATSRFSGFGTTESVGDLDFFPNGGRSQPGCKDLGPAVWSFLQHPSLKPEGLDEIMCNHHRAIELFMDSAKENACDMVGVMCATWEDFLERYCGSCYETPPRCVIMGYDAQTSWRLTRQRRANVYLNTTASPPYCQEM